MKKIYFRKEGEEANDAELLTDCVKKIRIDSYGKVLSFTVVPNNKYILNKFKNTLFEKNVFEIWIIYDDKASDSYAKGQLIMIEELSDDLYSFDVLLYGDLVSRGE
ncbi:unnamed protein product [Fructobacillus evanidus]|uniref:Uncharacterized protein n=1 Tax=Fructobacillus evanidus TaxID=3064281 RepID=A0ABM9N247_9LACO|nr:unnamed protein product [Fructobacillus sp. LMG 32999]CAK1231125.1 unnamed protein product [Fructobacillus sp. LMG 32999]CAK1243234.1 unnamed protein product [Fructobacillus sp. LMG 32999]CAK1254506.1 unnamed protein product [Fructobacillus sp. LMG 32999]CAK1254607.1 unnamed protein product [Fructobacillus sp. LMG 32999]